MKNELPDPQPGEVWRLTGISYRSGLMDLNFIHGAVVLVVSRSDRFSPTAGFRVLHAPNWDPPRNTSSAHLCWFDCRLDPGIAILYGADA